MNGLIFPRKGRSICGFPEIRLAQSLKATKLELIEGLHVPTTDEQIFHSFVGQCLNNRERYKNDGDRVSELFWKELVNSSYGKLAQGLKERRVYNLKSRDTQRLQESKVTNPYFASFITSFVRAVLGEIMNEIVTLDPSKKKIVFSVTTDGFITNADEGLVTYGATKGELSTQYTQRRRVGE
ncbi:MAG: hypothetical protein HN461_19545 [Rhodospirillaceae bacterium]|nr:hypothetical protein [Rhodospirillaceae bacterium]